MENVQFQPIEIPKEIINHLRFPTGDVLNNEEDKEVRKRDLMRALALGNLEHHKITTYFEDGEGLKYVNTTYWGVTEDNVILKYGMILPICRIKKIVI